MNFNPFRRLIGGSLQRQLMLGVLLVVSLSMSIFVWDINRQQRRLLNQQDIGHFILLSEGVASASAVDLATRDFAALQELVNKQSGYQEFLFAMVLDVQGRVLAHTDSTRLNQFVTGLPTQFKTTVLQQSDSMIEVAAPVRLGTRVVGWVRVASSREALHQQFAHLNQRSLIYLAVVLLSSVLFAAIGSGYIARRLHAITRVARNIEAGDTHLRVDVQGSDETAQLASHFNAMLDAIADRDAALKASESFKNLILNSVAAEVAVLDAHGVIVLVNAQWQRFGQMNGAPTGKQQVLGVGANYLQVCRQSSDTGDPVATAALTGLEAVMLRREDVFSMDYPCHAPQQQRWFTLMVRPFGHDAQRGVVITHTDITATKVAEQYEHFRGQVLELMAGDTDVQDLLLAMVRGVEQLHPAMMCSVVLLSDDGRHIGRSVAPSVPAFFNMAIEGLEIGPGQGSCGTAAFTGERVVVEDIATHPYWAKFKDLAARAGLAACWSQPIFSSAGKVLGTFAIYHRQVHTPSDADIELIRQTARLAGIAIEHKRTQSALQISEKKFRTLFETTPVGVIYQNVEGHITSANPAAQRILGLSLDQLQGRTSMDPRWHAIHEDGSDFPGDQHPVMLALKTGQPQRDTVMGIVAPGRDYVWIMVSATPLLEDGKVVQAYAMFEDITDRHLMQQKIRQLAFYDPLTQLPNRRLLTERLSHTLTAIKRSGALGAMLFLDLDNFKPLNDTHGHQTGDLLLVEVARRIKACVREEDTVARLGGDEFVVMLTDLQSEPQAARVHVGNVAQKICTSLAQPYRFRIGQSDDQQQEIEHRCSASIGVTLFSVADADHEQIMRRADAAMYRAKDQGRNRVVFAE